MTWARTDVFSGATLIFNGTTDGRDLMCHNESPSSQDLGTPPVPFSRLIEEMCHEVGTQ